MVSNPRAVRPGHAAGVFRRGIQQRPVAGPEGRAARSSSTGASISRMTGTCFRSTGKAGETIVAEVTARRLDSPLDSMLKLTDATGKLLAFNDDHEDVGCGLNTHHADSYLMVELPADGTYFVHLGDTARNGGKAYAYRLRISPPRPDFELRVVPSSASFRSKGAAALNVYAIRKDGFAGDIKLSLKDPPGRIYRSDRNAGGRARTWCG